jgi:hypothetical protein
MVAGPSKGPDRNQRPSTTTSTSTCTSTITVFVDVDVDVLVHVDVFFKSDRGMKHTLGNVKLLLPPRQSRGISQRIRSASQAAAPWAHLPKTISPSIVGPDVVASWREKRRKNPGHGFPLRIP